MAAWRRCSSCKTDLPFDTTYWVCSVSTCTRPRTGLFFCSVACWEAHLPTMRHREAWAVEERSPSAVEWQRMQREEEEAAAGEERAGDRLPARDPARVAATVPADAPAVARRRVEPPPPARDDALPRDILIVVSKLKKYIRARSGMNTSDNVMPALSEIVRRLCDQAIRNAGEDGRKTVLDRDFSRLS
jgi:hypothetical protein